MNNIQVVILTVLVIFLFEFAIWKTIELWEEHKLKKNREKMIIFRKMAYLYQYIERSPAHDSELRKYALRVLSEVVNDIATTKVEKNYYKDCRGIDIYVSNVSREENK